MHMYFRAYAHMPLLLYLTISHVPNKINPAVEINAAKTEDR